MQTAVQYCVDQRDAAKSPNSMGLELKFIDGDKDIYHSALQDTKAPSQDCLPLQLTHDPDIDIVALRAGLSSHDSITPHLSPAKSRHSCWECGERFSTLHDLLKHFKQHVTTGQCHLCQVTFRRGSSLAMHLENAHQDTSLVCSIFGCGEKTKNRWHLNQHLEICHPVQAQREQRVWMTVEEVVVKHEDEEPLPDENVSTDSVETMAEIILEDHPYFQHFTSGQALADHNYIRFNVDDNNDSEDNACSTIVTRGMAARAPIERDEEEIHEVEVDSWDTSSNEVEKVDEDINGGLIEGEVLNETESDDDVNEDDTDDMSSDSDSRVSSSSSYFPDEVSSDSDLLSDSSFECNSTSSESSDFNSKAKKRKDKYVKGNKITQVTSKNGKRCPHCWLGPYFNLVSHLAKCCNKGPNNCGKCSKAYGNNMNHFCVHCMTTVFGPNAISSHICPAKSKQSIVSSTFDKLKGVPTSVTKLPPSPLSAMSQATSLYQIIALLPPGIIYTQAPAVNKTQTTALSPAVSHCDTDVQSTGTQTLIKSDPVSNSTPVKTKYLVGASTYSGVSDGSIAGIQGHADPAVQSIATQTLIKSDPISTCWKSEDLGGDSSHSGSKASASLLPVAQIPVGTCSSSATSEPVLLQTVPQVNSRSAMCTVTHPSPAVVHISSTSQTKLFLHSSTTCTTRMSSSTGVTSSLPSSAEPKNTNPLEPPRTQPPAVTLPTQTPIVLPSSADTNKAIPVSGIGGRPTAPLVLYCPSRAGIQPPLTVNNPTTAPTATPSSPSICTSVSPSPVTPLSTTVPGLFHPLASSGPNTILIPVHNAPVGGAITSPATTKAIRPPVTGQFIPVERITTPTTTTDLKPPVTGQRLCVPPITTPATTMAIRPPVAGQLLTRPPVTTPATTMALKPAVAGQLIRLAPVPGNMPGVLPPGTPIFSLRVPHPAQTKAPPTAVGTSTQKSATVSPPLSSNTLCVKSPVPSVAPTTPFPSLTAYQQVSSPSSSTKGPILVTSQTSSTSNPLSLHIPQQKTLPTPSQPPASASPVNQNLPQSPTLGNKLQILFMFLNQSREQALARRMKVRWHYKEVISCRLCGAISRQPSLVVLHRYHHRRTPYRFRCSCGRRFHARLHLLRHQLRHAENTRYICASCGESFEGAQRLLLHKAKSKRAWKRLKSGGYGFGKYITSTHKNCQKPFACTCGRTFARPSALLWHNIINDRHKDRT